MFIPGDFFGPGCLPFVGRVNFTGVPLDPTISTADTIVKRLENASPKVDEPVTIPIEIVALSLEGT